MWRVVWRRIWGAGRNRSLKREKGQALVEFAMILPLLLLLLLGMVEFARVFNAGLVVTHCSREGARLAVTGGSDTLIINRAIASAPSLDSSLLEVTVTPIEADRARGQEVRVLVRYPVPMVAPVISIITGETVTVQSATVMRME